MRGETIYSTESRSTCAIDSAIVHLVLALRVRGQRRGRDDRQVDVGQRGVLVAESV